MRCKLANPTAALAVAVISGAFALPCAAQQAGLAPAGPVGFGPGVTPGTPMVPPMAQPGPPAALALPGPAPAPVAAATTVTTTSTTVLAPTLPSSTSMAASLAASAYSSSTTTPAPQAAYAAPGGGIINPALPTLQSTIGTIETGSASSAPIAEAGVPLNMAPAGVALNSDLSGVPIVASYGVPGTRAMGAGPSKHIAYLQPPTTTRTPAPATSAMGAPPVSQAMRPPRADRN